MKNSGKNKTVAIVGFAQSTMHEVNESKADEIWSVNYAHRYDLPRIDRLFELHPLEWLAVYGGKRTVEHHEWLHKEHEFPIYTYEQYEEMPNSVAMDWDRLYTVFNLNRRGDREEGQPYLTSTINYMVLWAVLEGFERIELYGVQMSSGTEYGYQKAALEWSLGYAQGRGVEVWLPEICELMHARVYHEGGQMLPPEEVTDQLAHYKYEATWYQDKAAHNQKAGDLEKQTTNARKALMYRNAETIVQQIFEAAGGMSVGRQDLETQVPKYQAYLEQAQARNNYMWGVISEMERTGQDGEDVAAAKEKARTYQMEAYARLAQLQAIENMIGAIDKINPSLEITDKFFKDTTEPTT
ncbi:MAG: hypothetical protein KAJ07_04795 [Planctomycetes bacterium]|nr:hypothetical protein [Planctomycetota bacterium]